MPGERMRSTIKERHMVYNQEIVISRASVDDIEEILALQKIVYVSEAEIISDFLIPPLQQTMSGILSEFNHQTFLKATLEQKIVGSVRCYLKGETCHIGKLIVHPQHQNLGIGTRLLLAAERHFPQARRFELFTGHKSAKNLHIYRKNSYRIFKNQKISDRLTFVFLEKFRDISQQQEK
jgi:ribosomal protein S18 acetylase RimI-like enzyme